MTTPLRPSPATAEFIEEIRAMRRGDLKVGDDCGPLVKVLRAYQAEDERSGRNDYNQILRGPPGEPLSDKASDLLAKLLDSGNK